jgi:BMFP domain-containing protein YqiC
MSSDQTHRDQTQSDDTMISAFLERLRQQIDMVLPEDSVNTVLAQARSALRQGFAEFELVGRHELDAHLAALKQLTATVKDLEQRIAELETHG